MAMYLRILATMFVATSVIADDEFQEKRSETAEKAANNKREQIHAEIKKLGTHDWAGDYYAGDGLGVNTSLFLAPNSGYVFEWHGCLGLYDRNYGAVTSTNDRLRLSFTFKNTREGFQGIAPEFSLVRWGTRRYLVPADDLVGFCNHVNQGAEPRTHARGFYLLRRGDENLKVCGSPELPADFRDYLLSKPVEASVLVVGPSTIRPSRADWKFKETQLTLDAGKKQGLRVGMELVVTQPQDIVESVRITRVEDIRAEAIMTQLGEDERGPKVGWQFSTKARWHARTIR